MNWKMGSTTRLPLTTRLIDLTGTALCQVLVRKKASSTWREHCTPVVTPWRRHRNPLQLSDAYSCASGRHRHRDLLRDRHHHHLLLQGRRHHHHHRTTLTLETPRASAIMVLVLPLKTAPSPTFWTGNRTSG